MQCQRAAAPLAPADVAVAPKGTLKNDQNLTPLLHSSLQPFLSLLVTTLSSAFDSDREPERRGGKVSVPPYAFM